jgi:phosphoenolpyruvate-protein kinase (PTS system EI component)
MIYCKITSPREPRPDRDTMRTNQGAGVWEQFADEGPQPKRSSVGTGLAQTSCGPCRTKEGIPISVLATVGCRTDTDKAMTYGADGVGLYGMKRAYLSLSSPPSSAELAREMRHTFKAARGLQVYVRILRFSTDAPLPFMRFITKTHQSGNRGTSCLRHYPDLLRTSLRAVLELTGDFDVRILIPAVVQADDVVVVKEHLQELAREMQVSNLPRLGAVLETLPAVLAARDIAVEADFLSFSSDLTQTAFTADRDGAAVDQYFDDAAEAVFDLLSTTHRHVPDIPLSISGRLPARPELIPRLLQCGIRTLCVAPILVPMIKDAISESWCTALAPVV